MTGGRHKDVPLCRLALAVHQHLFPLSSLPPSVLFCFLTVSLVSLCDSSLPLPCLACWSRARLHRAARGAVEGDAFHQAWRARRSGYRPRVCHAHLKHLMDGLPETVEVVVDEACGTEQTLIRAR